MSTLSRDAILQASDLPFEEVAVPAWGGTVRVRAMTGRDRDAFGESLARDEQGNVDLTNYRAKLVAKCLVDDAGNRLFTDSDADIAALGGKSAAALAVVFDAAERLNGIGAAAVEDVKKNSDLAPSDSSTSA